MTFRPGYMAFRTDDEIFDASDLVLLVHAHLDVAGHRFEGSRMRAALSGDEAMLEIEVRDGNGTPKAIRLPDHDAVEEAIARSRGTGVIEFDLEEVFHDSGRSGSGTIHETAAGLGVPVTAFGLEGIGDDTNRVEAIGDALAGLAAIRMFKGPEIEHERTVTVSFQKGLPLVNLVGRAEDGEMDRTIILDEVHHPASTSPMKDIAQALRTVAADGPGRSYNALAADGGGMVRIDAALLVGPYESVDKERCDAALERLRIAVDAAAEPRKTRPVRAPRRDGTAPVSFGKGPGSVGRGGADLSAMFGVRGKGSGR